MATVHNSEKLSLIRCESLVALPETIGNCTQLKELNLGGCESLAALPEAIGNCTQLKKLDLSGCSSLAALPETIGNCTQLKELDLSGGWDNEIGVSTDGCDLQLSDILKEQLEANQTKIVTE